MTPILTITGSDNSGWSGLQLDLKIITEMGAHALTAATCIVMPGQNGTEDIVNFPTPLIEKQITAIRHSNHPRAVKVGLVRSADSAIAIAHSIIGCRNIVVAPGIMASSGTQLVNDDTVTAIRHHLIPQASLLVLRQAEAEKILGTRIVTDQDMLTAAQTFIQMGTEYVLLRGGRIQEGRVTALLMGAEHQQFFNSYNIEGWKQHGVGGALSTAITTRLGMGDNVPTAISNAHEYVHSRIVYAVSQDSKRLRPADIYNTFMNLLSDNYQTAHDVTFYADRLNITTRYLSQITGQTVSKSPKHIIAEFLISKATQQLENSRLSIKEISDQLGFSNSAVFCKFFRQQTLISPSEYRNSVYSLS